MSYVPDNNFGGKLTKSALKSLAKLLLTKPKRRMARKAPKRKAPTKHRAPKRTMGSSHRAPKRATRGTRRTLNPYQKFVQKERLKGRTMSEIGAMWSSR